MHSAEAPSNPLADQVSAMLERHWVGEGYAAPNSSVYPWQWLWDSCFHVVVWAELGREDRAVTELTQALRAQDEMGFVPHMNYQRDPTFHADLWGREGSSSITQPPMYGHAVAELVRRGVDVPGHLVEQARSGLRFLLEHRTRSESGLVSLCHPWESGADDSPRWDDLCPGGFDLTRWRATKNELLDPIERSPVGSPLANPAFDVASVGFNALIAFNAMELAAIGVDGGLAAEADRLRAALERRWDAPARTWVDAGQTDAGSGRIRTLDGLLPLLVVTDREQVSKALWSLTDRSCHGAEFGPTGVHRAEDVYSPRTYWRGPAWPQLSYLLWVAARRQGDMATADTIARSTVAGASISGLAEYWDADTGEGLGARPQSWTGLALVMEG